jgi:hypothetical protein
MTPPDEFVMRKIGSFTAWYYEAERCIWLCDEEGGELFRVPDELEEIEAYLMMMEREKIADARRAFNFDAVLTADSPISTETPHWSS